MGSARCLFCGGDTSERDHWQRCDGRQGAVEACEAWPNRAEVNELRDRAMESVETNAERARRMFAADAGVFVIRYLSVHGPTAGEVLTKECRAAGITAHDDRAMGPVYMRLARAGLIEKVGRVRRERGHGTAGGHIWAIARLEGARD